MKSSCRSSTLKPLLAALLSLPLASFAATPDAGSLLQQLKPQAAPTPSSGNTGLTITPSGGAQLPPSAPFAITILRITGNTVFDTATLHGLVADAEGKSLTLPELDTVVARITAYYHDHGYPLARAIVPAQTLSNGTVRVEVIEARYGKVQLDNRSRTHDGLLQSTLAPLKGGQMVEQAQMNQVLLLLSDIPGVRLNASLKPGAEVGTSDLDVQATADAAFAGNVSLDSYGNRYTGKTRIGAALDLVNPLHAGDLLSANVLASGSGMDYLRLAYDKVLNGRGTRAGGAYSSVHYVLGDTMAPLNAHGTAQVASLWLKQPLVRTPALSLYGQLQYDRNTLRDRIDANAIRTDRHLDNWVLSLSGDARTPKGAIDSWSLSLTSGHVAFDDGPAQLADAATGRTEGRFNKWNLNLSRLQAFGAVNELALTLAGQWSNGNLDSSQKLAVGGPYTVRAYDMGALSGDSGYTASVELRHRFATSGWQALAFVDGAQVTVNHTPWAAGPNSATLSGAGLGLAWSGMNRWHARACVAKRLGSAPTLLPNAASTRGWVEVDRDF